LFATAVLLLAVSPFAQQPVAIPKHDGEIVDARRRLL
jgi:hypothetical protein